MAPVSFDPKKFMPKAIDPGQTTSETVLGETPTFGPTRTALGRTTKWVNATPLKPVTTAAAFKALGINRTNKKGGRRRRNRNRKSRKQRR